tara:strand:- start:139012 stop:139431 length:420 start_codon:yes stop_codon:yes gene_type:complete
MDPGKVNFAWVHYCGGEVLEYGWIKVMTDVHEDVVFINNFVNLLTRLNPDYVVLERFMIRNRGQSVHSEPINQMIGRISVLTRVFGYRMTNQVTPAQWKTWFNKQQKENWEETFSFLPSVHSRDAAGIAKYFDLKKIPH